MPEIVKKTGINRKAWNQRFSRLERKHVVTNKISQIGNPEKPENVTAQNDNDADKLTISPVIVANNNIERWNKTDKFLSALAVIGIMVTIYFIYMEIKKRRNKPGH